MNEFKSVLFYILSVAGLVVATALFSPQAESNVRLESANIPTAALATAAVAKARPTRPALTAGPEGCITTPFIGSDGYRPDAPFTSRLAPAETTAELLTVSGRVYAADCKTPLRGVVLEVWQADSNGEYGSAALRGRLITDRSGQYEFVTVKPSRSMAFQKYIPARIHFKVSHPAMSDLNIQLYFEGDPFLQQHFSSEAVERLTRPIIVEDGPDGPQLRTTFDIVLSIEPPPLRPSRPGRRREMVSQGGI